MISLVLRGYGAVNEGSPFISLEFWFTWVSHPFCLLVNPLGICEAVMLTASLTNLGPLICRPAVHLASGETLFNVYTHSCGLLLLTELGVYGGGMGSLRHAFSLPTFLELWSPPLGTYDDPGFRISEQSHGQQQGQLQKGREITLWVQPFLFLDTASSIPGTPV